MSVKAFGTDERYGFSQAVRLGDVLFVSGQVAWDDAGNLVGRGDAFRQAERAFENLKRHLLAAGSGLDRVGKLMMLATSLEHLAAIREVRHRLFDPLGHYPASTFAVVTSLAAPELLVEVEAIATCAP